MALHYDAGVYLVEPIEHAFNESSNGKPMITAKVRPIERVYQAGMDGEYRDAVEDNKYERYVNFVLDPTNEQSQAITMKKLRTAGWTGTSFSEFSLDSPFLCNCDHSEYKGKPTEQWDVYLPARVVEHKPELAAKMDGIMDKMLKSETLASAAPEKTIDVRQPAGTAPGSPLPGDDVPFFKMDDRV